MKELARRVGTDPSFLSRVERGLVPAPEGLVRRIAAELRVEAEPLLAQAGHLPDDVRSLFDEHPREAIDVLRATFRRRDERLEVGL